MTFVEARRNRVTWALTLFFLVILLTSFLFQEVTIVAYDRIMRDVGFAAIHAFGVMLAVYLGVSVVSREIDRRTVYYLLTKPLSRTEYLIGKLLGVWLVLIISLGFMLAAFCAEHLLFSAPLGSIVFQAFWLMLVELLLIASFSLLASTFTSPIMSAFMAVGLFLIGHLSSHLFFFSKKSDVGLVRAVGKALFFALPDLEKLNLKTQVSLLTAIDASAVLQRSIYGFVFVAAFLALSIALFSRRDLR